jgi:predicted nucleic acid-binding protein
VADADDADHDRCVEVLRRRELQLVVPTMVVAEATYLVGTRLGASAEAAFLRGVGDLEVEPPSPDDWPRIANLVERYADFPLGGTDASVIALAERVRASVVVTLDRRHFAAAQPLHRPAFDLLPA